MAEQVGLSRRMIQEYEKAGLVEKPKRKNKYGHLLYDEKTIDRLWQIRFYRAFQYYCDKIGNSRADMECLEAYDNLERLAYARYSADSEEIQREVKKIHNCYRGMKILTEDTQLEMLERTGKLYGSQVYRDEFDDGREKGVAWFISKAIEIYCSNYRQKSASAGITSQEGG